MNKLFLATAMTVSLVNFAHAADDQGSGKVNFTGSIVDAPCSISSDSDGQTVSLGAVSNTVLKDGGKSEAAAFTIQLEQCDFSAGKNKVKTTFTGVVSAYATNTELLAISGDASGAGIGIKTYNGEQLSLGEASKSVQLVGANPTLSYQAYLQGGLDGDGASVEIVPGPFTAVANFQLAYE